MTEDLTPQARCWCCGQETKQLLPDQIPPDLIALPEWRCYTCFSQVPGWRLHCSQCGGTHGNAQSSQYPLLYDTVGMNCACAAPAPSADDELKNVTHIVSGFAVLAITLVIGAVLKSEGHEARDDIIASAVLYSVIFIYTLVNWRLVLPLLKLPAKSIPMILVAIVAAPVTVALANLQLVVFPGMESYWMDYSTSYISEGFGWGGALISIAVGPAIFEELFFRGVMLHRLNRVMTGWQAIIVTAAAFAILHLSAIGLVFYLVPMAIIAGWLTLRSKSLWPAMLFHFLHNASIVYLEYRDTL